MKNNKLLKLLIYAVLFVIITGCSANTPRSQKTHNNDSNNSLINEYKSVGRKLSAIPLWFYHNKVKVFRVCEIDPISGKINSAQYLDSLQYKQRLLRFSTQCSEDDRVSIEGVMTIDSILYGYNVFRIDVTHDSTKYHIYSLKSRKKRHIKDIAVGESYYLKIKPYFFQDSTDEYHNSGLYLNGYVIRDYDLELQEWKHVCTSNSIDGLTPLK
ncbi:MAG: hypothetical protein IKJ81_03845 [Bacteroidales bacterium]|nr:hypothetical protein [Bacteroidales bacterium]